MTLPTQPTPDAIDAALIRLSDYTLSVNDPDTIKNHIRALRAENENLKVDRERLTQAVGLMTTAKPAVEVKTDAGAISPEYRAQTVLLLRLYTEVFRWAGMDRDTFAITYLNNFGEYERKVAAEEGISVPSLGTSAQAGKGAL